MTRLTELKRLIIITIVAVIVTSTTGYLVSAHSGDPPVTVPSTGEEPIGTPGANHDPTPVWATPIASPEANPGDPSLDPGIIQLPSTGAGTTARASPQRNHTGWIFMGYSCPLFGG